MLDPYQRGSQTTCSAYLSLPKPSSSHVAVHQDYFLRSIFRNGHFSSIKHIHSDLSDSHQNANLPNPNINTLPLPPRLQLLTRHNRSHNNRHATRLSLSRRLSLIPRLLSHPLHRLNTPASITPLHFPLRWFPNLPHARRPCA